MKMALSEKRRAKNTKGRKKFLAAIREWKKEGGTRWDCKTYREDQAGLGLAHIPGHDVLGNNGDRFLQFLSRPALCCSRVPWIIGAWQRHASPKKHQENILFFISIRAGADMVADPVSQQ